MKILEQGLEQGVFPLARAEVFLEGKHVISAGNAPPQMYFDLASITKVMCTTAVAMEMIRAKDLAFTTEIAGSRVDDLLYHRAGLPAFRPFFVEALAAWPELLTHDCPKEVREAGRSLIIASALSLQKSPKRQAVYSDIGFILLGHLLEELGKARLDALFFQYVATTLNLTAGFRSLSPAPPMPGEMAPTGVKRPRDPAPGQEGMWEIAQVYSGLGEVDDDNAWAMGGVAGHAGLFGTALDVALFGQAVLEGKYAPPNDPPWEVDNETPGSTRALGFEVPGLDFPSCGLRFGRAGPKGAIGHTGFTGTSLWIDFDRKLVVSLCTNRVALGRLNLKIRHFRPEFHDAVLDELKL